MTGYVLTPAYGRDYKSKAEVERDWNSNKDFVANRFDGREAYINKEQCKGQTIQVRYNRLRNVCFVKS